MLIAQESISIEIRQTAEQSSRPMAPDNGLINAIINPNVSKTAKWAITRLPDFTPLTKPSNKTPAKTGINAVGDGVCDPQYPIKPKVIKTIAFNMLTTYTFIPKKLNFFTEIEIFDLHKHNNKTL